MIDKMVRLTLVGGCSWALLSSFFEKTGVLSSRGYEGNALAFLMVVMGAWVSHLAGEVWWHSLKTWTRGNQQTMIKLESLSFIVLAFPLAYFGISRLFLGLHSGWLSFFILTLLAAAFLSAFGYLGYRSEKPVVSR